MRRRHLPIASHSRAETPEISAGIRLTQVSVHTSRRKGKQNITQSRMASLPVVPARRRRQSLCQ